MELIFRWHLLGTSSICVQDRQEYLLYQVYRQLGLSEEGILRHFTGVHFAVSFSKALKHSPGIVWAILKVGVALFLYVSWKRNSC